MDLTSIGAGNMGRGIGTRPVAGGNHVRILANDPAAARELAGDQGDLMRRRRWRRDY